MKKIIISGGGTGGHIYPAIAIANEFRRQYPQVQILFVGAKGRMEMQKVPEAGYSIEGLWISGIQRKLTWDNLSFPIKLISSLWKARQIIKRFCPDIIIGTGGYASAPMLKMAEWTGVPYFIQEQNSIAGVTNKWVAGGAKKIFVAYQGMEHFFPKEKIFLTGNPVRQDLLEIETKKEQAFAHFSLQKEKPTLLVLGGSLGAKTINQLIENQLDLFIKLGVQVLWQCGKMYYETYKKYDSQNIRVLPFIREIDQAYALSDIIISRAGASSVSELCIVGKPVIFIPSPNVAEDHQTRNAQAIAQYNAAILIKENELEERFVSQFSELISSTEKQQSLSQEIKKLALPNATQTIVNQIVNCVKNDKF